MSKQKKEQENNTMGIAGLVLSIIGLIILPPLFGTLGIIFSSIGLSRGQKYSGVGLVIGIIDLAVFILLIALFMMLFAIAI